MTPPKGRRVAALPGSAPKRRKNAKDKTAAANLALMIKAQAKRIEVREAGCDIRDAEVAKREEQQAKKAAKREERQSKKEENHEQQHAALSASLTAREVDLERREAAFEQCMKEEALAKPPTPQRQARQQAATVVRDDLARPRGALLDASQSRDILLLYYGLVESGMEENPAVARTAELLRIGKGKVFKVRTHWEDRKAFLTSSGEGRGAATAEDARRVLSSEQCCVPSTE